MRDVIFAVADNGSCLLYTSRLTENFKLLAGGLIDANGGFVYNLRNTNNPEMCIRDREGTTYIKRFAVTSVVRDREYDVTQGTPDSRITYFSACLLYTSKKVYRQN